MTVSLNRIASAIAMDNWEEIGENTNIWNPEEETTDILIDPLYIVCSQLRQNPDISSSDLYQYLKSILDNSDENLSMYTAHITPEDMMLAKEIRNHFRNKLMFRRLKDQPISGFMKIVDKIIENDQSYNQEMIPILTKLPGFFNEDMETSAIFKQAQNPKKWKKMSKVDFDTDFTFVGTVDRDSRARKIQAFYFLNPERTLFAINSKKDSVDCKAWAYIASKPSIHMKGTARRCAKPGQEIYYWEIESNVEIAD